MDKYERQLKAIELEMREVLAKARKITDSADGALGEDEEKELNGYFKNLEVLKEKKAEVEAAIETRKRVEDATKSLLVEDEGVKSDKSTPAHRRARSIGEAFVKSDGYRQLKDKGIQGKWSSGSVEIEGKTLLDSDGIGQEDAGLIQADVQPGILPILTQAPTIASLLAQGVTSSPLVRVLVEKTATSGAAGVAESGEKPESTFEFDATDESVKKIATFLPVTDEMVEDVPQLVSYINGRLAQFIRQEEDDQLLNGAGGDDLEGIMGRVPGGNTDLQSTVDAAQAADHVYAAITACRAAFFEPDAVVMNPADWADIQLLKDGNDRYFGSGPFAPPAAQTLWGLRVVITQNMTATKALVGAFGSMAQIFRKGGLSVEASNSHADFFLHNKTAIRAEERLALAVYRPEAFATADLT